MKSFGWLGVVIGFLGALLALGLQFERWPAGLIGMLIAVVLGMLGVVVGSDSLDMTTKRGLYAATVATGLVAGAAGWRLGGFFIGVLVAVSVYFVLLGALVALRKHRDEPAGNS